MYKRALACLLILAMLGGCGDSPEHQLQQAQIAQSNLRFDLALKHADRVLAQRPDDAEAQMIRADALYRLGNLLQCRRVLDTLVKTQPTWGRGRDPCLRP